MPIDPIFWAAFIGFFVVSIIGSILRASWNRLYYTMGLPLFIIQGPDEITELERIGYRPDGI
jgi:hypothetical protein